VLNSKKLSNFFAFVLFSLIHLVQIDTFYIFRTTGNFLLNIFNLQRSSQHAEETFCVQFYKCLCNRKFGLVLCCLKLTTSNAAEL